MRTGFSTQYERAPPRLVSTCINKVMHESLRLATKNMKASQRTYVQPEDLLAAFKQMACNSDFIRGVELPDTCDVESDELSLSMAGSVSIQEEEDDEGEQKEAEAHQEAEAHAKGEAETFSWPSDAQQQADDELYQMWSAGYTYRSIEEMEEDDPQPIRRALMRTIEKMEELIAQLNS